MPVSSMASGLRLRPDRPPSASMSSVSGSTSGRCRTRRDRSRWAGAPPSRRARAGRAGPSRHDRAGEQPHQRVAAARGRPRPGAAHTRSTTSGVLQQPAEADHLDRQAGGLAGRPRSATNWERVRHSTAADEARRCPPRPSHRSATQAATSSASSIIGRARTPAATRPGPGVGPGHQAGEARAGSRNGVGDRVGDVEDRLVVAPAGRQAAQLGRRAVGGRRTRSGSGRSVAALAPRQP